MITFTNIIVKLQIEGFHCWPGAKDTPMQEIHYLADPHRHVFHITCFKDVNHDDRDIEIIEFKRQVTQYLLQQYPDKLHPLGCDFGSMSCEMIARELLLVFGMTMCRVLEDGENGGVVRQEIRKWNQDVVFVCGYPCSGKETFIRAYLNNRVHIRVSDIVKHLSNAKTTSELNDTANLDKEIAKELMAIISDHINAGSQVVIDGIRQPSIYGQILQRVQLRGSTALTIWLEVPYDIREFRYNKRGLRRDDLSYKRVCEKNDQLGLDVLQKSIQGSGHMSPYLPLKYY